MTLEVPAACDGPDLAGAKLSIHVETLDGCFLDDLVLPVENGSARHEVSLPRCGCYYIDTALSLGADCAVQDVEYARLKEVLLSGGQVIAAE